eukprot:CAMPEP_0176337952 /NCGR_PEP_ID=MMETSP0121_2-20121125/79892_1 /TAXON_ID=160619 /ORGANISM="Kryptoperidinium foliaceum, Strain CCMP 1326" /LENGTH=390 /DNA_ID=CAMNT_0017680967 /DNA_START=14 /DNA_END=1184 /DNA_ORIENTATION=-
MAAPSLKVAQSHAATHLVRARVRNHRGPQQPPRRHFPSGGGVLSAGPTAADRHHGAVRRHRGAVRLEALDLLQRADGHAAAGVHDRGGLGAEDDDAVPLRQEGEGLHAARRVVGLQQAAGAPAGVAVVNGDRGALQGHGGHPLPADGQQDARLPPHRAADARDEGPPCRRAPDDDALAAHRRQATAAGRGGEVADGVASVPQLVDHNVGDEAPDEDGVLVREGRAHGDAVADEHPYHVRHAVVAAVEDVEDVAGDRAPDDGALVRAQRDDALPIGEHLRLEHSGLGPFLPVLQLLQNPASDRAPDDGRAVEGSCNQPIAGGEEVDVVDPLHEVPPERVGRRRAAQQRRRPDAEGRGHLRLHPEAEDVVHDVLLQHLRRLRIHMAVLHRLD